MDLKAFIVFSSIGDLTDHNSNKRSENHSAAVENNPHNGIRC